MALVLFEAVPGQIHIVWKMTLLSLLAFYVLESELYIKTPF